MKFILVFCSLLFLVENGWSQNKKLRVYLDTKQYFEPSQGSFVEINFQFVGHTIEMLGESGGLKGELAVLLNFVQFDDTIVSDAYRLESPLMKDSIVEDFYDIRRFSMEPGKYKLHVQIFDLIEKSEPVTGTLNFTVEERDKTVSFGDIQNIEYATKGNPTSVFFKSGYDIFPRLSNYYPEELNALPYYTEVYNTMSFSTPEFGLKESIYLADPKTELETFTKIYRFKTDDIVPVLKQVDISELPSGNYYLSLTVIDGKMNETSEKKFFFERVNNERFVLSEEIALDPAFEESIPKDSVAFYLASLIPISYGESSTTILRTLKEKNDEKSIKLIQSFWMGTAKAKAYESWMKYKEQVQYTERLYRSNLMAGFETDRGRVYLQYGAPTNVVIREVTADEYPHEIWQYNQIGKMSNRHFVFFNPDLINNYHQLLHSDMIGERKNANWPIALRVIDAYKGETDNQNTGVPNTFQDQNNLLFRNR